MRSRSSWVLYGGFGTLVVLIAVLGIGAMRRAQAIHARTIAAHEAYFKTDLLVRDLPADLYLSGILVRDYILDLSPLNAQSYRQQLRQQQDGVVRKLELLRSYLPAAQTAPLDRLTTEVTAYWDSLDPIFEWTAQEKLLASHSFLQDRVLRRRESVINMAAEISQINAANLAREQNRLQQSELDLEQFLLRMLLFTLTLGVVVSALSIYRLSSLESRGAAQRERAERAEKQLRRLSHGLVKAQEEERKNISRELHDALGQKLSYIGMELGALDDHRSAGTAEIHARLEDIKRLVTESIRFVRDLSMTLRPAMLDELGLGSALRWQAREFARRTSIEVDVQLHGDLDGLPETHRINIYRVVQEGLTNCAKHSKAKTVRIGVYGDDTTVRLTIQDDGVGFDSSTPRRGLGLIGIEERVSELGGTLTITSTPGKGTLLEAQAPLHPVSTETPFPAPSQVVPS